VLWQVLCPQGATLQRDGLLLELKLLEPNRQPVTIGKILIPPRPANHLPDDPFEPEFEKRAIVDSSSRSETWMRKSGSIPIKLASKAA
jgi:hypothetical protein